jgi:hypothetical protein
MSPLAWAAVAGVLPCADRHVLLHLAAMLCRLTLRVNKLRSADWHVFLRAWAYSKSMSSRVAPSGTMKDGRCADGNLVP